jgi:hypothetical protein
MNNNLCGNWFCENADALICCFIWWRPQWDGLFIPIFSLFGKRIFFSIPDVD